MDALSAGGTGGTGSGSATTSAPRGHAAPKRITQSARLQQQIKALILQRGLTAGDPLPTELELIEELGGSRGTIREAVKALQALGLIEVRHGYGTYVGHVSIDALVQGLAFHSRTSSGSQIDNLADLVEIRQGLEVGLVQLLIEQRSDTDLADAERIADEMAAASVSGPVPPELDQNFHEALYRPLNNKLAVQLLRAFWTAYTEAEDILRPAEIAFSRTAEDHREILRAIRAGDRKAAADAVIQHFNDIRARITHPSHAGGERDEEMKAPKR